MSEGESKKVDTTRCMVIAAVGGLVVGGVLDYLLTPRRVEVKEIPGDMADRLPRPQLRGANQEVALRLHTG